MTKIEFPKIKNKRKIPTFVFVNCPACKKDRLLKEDHEDGSVDEVSDETYEAVDSTTRFVDVCGFCQSKYDRRDRTFMKREIRKLQKAAEQAENEDSPDIEL